MDDVGCSQERVTLQDMGTMTPPVKILTSINPKRETSSFVDTGARKPPRPKPLLTLLAPPLVKLRQTTEDECHVEDALVDLVECTVQDASYSLAADTWARFTASGQNVEYNRQMQRIARQQRKEAVMAQRILVETKAKEAISKAKTRKSKRVLTTAVDSFHGPPTEFGTINNSRGPMREIEEKARDALRRSVRAGRLKKAREAAEIEEVLQQRLAEKNAERFRLQMQETLHVVESVLDQIVCRSLKIATGRCGNTQSGPINLQEKHRQVAVLYAPPAGSPNLHTASRMSLPGTTCVSMARHLRLNRHGYDQTEPAGPETFAEESNLALRESRLRSSGGWDNSPGQPLRATSAARHRDMSALLENPPSPTVPRRAVASPPKLRNALRLQSAHPGNRQASTAQQRCHSANPGIRQSNAYPLASEELPEEDEIASADIATPPRRFGPWHEAAGPMTDLHSEDLHVSAAVASKFGSSAAVPKQARQPAGLEVPYDEDYTAEAAARRRRAIMTASPAVWGEPLKPAPSPFLPDYFSMDYSPLWASKAASTPAWWASLCKLLASEEGKCQCSFMCSDMVFIQDGYLATWYRDDPVAGLTEVSVTQTTARGILKRFSALQAKARASVTDIFQCETDPRKKQCSSGAKAVGSYCKVPAAIAYTWDASTQKVVISPLTSRDFRRLCSQLHPASDQILNHPGMGDAKQELPFLIRPFSAFDGSKRTRYLTKLQICSDSDAPETFEARSFRWTDYSESATADETVPVPQHDVTTQLTEREELGSPAADGEDGLAVEYVLQNLIADAEAYHSGLEDIPSFMPATKTNGDVSDFAGEGPRTGGVKVTPNVRQELLSVTLRLVDHILLNHALSCSGLCTEWLRTLDGSLQLVAVHRFNWVDLPAHHLHRLLPTVRQSAVNSRALVGKPSTVRGTQPGWNTNTKRVTTFQAGSVSRPDRAEPPPASVHAGLQSNLKGSSAGQRSAVTLRPSAREHSAANAAIGRSAVEDDEFIMARFQLEQVKAQGSLHQYASGRQIQRVPEDEGHVPDTAPYVTGHADEAYNVASAQMGSGCERSPSPQQEDNAYQLPLSGGPGTWLYMATRQGLGSRHNLSSRQDVRLRSQTGPIRSLSDHDSSANTGKLCSSQPRTRHRKSQAFSSPKVTTSREAGNSTGQFAEPTDTVSDIVFDQFHAIDHAFTAGWKHLSSLERKQKSNSGSAPANPRGTSWSSSRTPLMQPSHQWRGMYSSQTEHPTPPSSATDSSGTRTNYRSTAGRQYLDIATIPNLDYLAQ